MLEETAHKSYRGIHRKNTDQRGPADAIHQETNAEVMLLSDRSLGLLAFVSLSGLYFFAIFQRVGMAAIVYDLSGEFGADASILGLMSGMYFYSYALAQIPVGMMLDRIGIRKTLTILGGIACAGDLVFSLRTSSSEGIPQIKDRNY
jgi:sugar phosphate permease